MKGNARLIKSLNEVLTAELVAINQYFVHSMMCRNWGYHQLAEKIREESLDEMKHAEQLIERILHLEGVPNVEPLGKVTVGRKVPEQLRLDLELEKAAIDRLNKAIALAMDVADNASRELLDKILSSEDEHVSWIETQLEIIEQIGEQNYLAQQIR